MEVAYAIEFKNITNGNIHKFIERVEIVDSEIITRKGKDGVLISISAIANSSDAASNVATESNGFKSINIIIENPKNAKNVIVGNIEIPFPEDGETKVQTINDIISIRLLKFKNSNSGNIISSFSEEVSNAKEPEARIASISPPPGIPVTYANRLSGDFKTINNKIINPKMSELLKNAILKYKKEFNIHTCYEKNNKGSCIMEASRLNSGDYSICGQCKRFLSSIREFKCKQCNNAVFIDGKGSARNEYCNECAKQQNKQNA